MRGCPARPRHGPAGAGVRRAPDMPTTFRQEIALSTAAPRSGHRLPPHRARVAALAAAFALVAGPAPAQGSADAAPPAEPATLAEAERRMFGHDDDTAFAALLWEVMKAERLAGPDPIRSYPYEGVPPHGVLLEIFYASARVDGQSGALIVKRNYGPEAVTRDEIIADPEAHLNGITVMFRRAPGWDAGVQDWFFADYLPDGTLTRTDAGTPNAGAVGKNLDRGCAACHIAAAGGDFVFTADYPLH